MPSTYIVLRLLYAHPRAVHLRLRSTVFMPSTYVALRLRSICLHAVYLRCFTFTSCPSSCRLPTSTLNTAMLHAVYLRLRAVYLRLRAVYLRLRAVYLRLRAVYPMSTLNMSLLHGLNHAAGELKDIYMSVHMYA